jgi:hypothetical protein
MLAAANLQNRTTLVARDGSCPDRILFARAHEILWPGTELNRRHKDFQDSCTGFHAILGSSELFDLVVFLPLGLHQNVPTASRLVGNFPGRITQKLHGRTQRRLLAGYGFPLTLRA